MINFLLMIQAHLEAGLKNKNFQMKDCTFLEFETEWCIKQIKKELEKIKL